MVKEHGRTAGEYILGQSAGFLKFVVLGFCVAYGLIGICFSGFGIFLIVELQKIPDLGDAAKWLPAIFLAVGIFLGVVATFGFAGAVTRNKCLLIIFATVTIFLLVLAFIFGIAVLVVAPQLSTAILHLLDKAFNKNPAASNTWLGPIETAAKCCGVNGPDDYTTIGIPKTCCEPGAIACTSLNAYPEGCGVKWTNTLQEYSKAIGGCCLALTILQALAVIGAYMLMSKSAS
ncbi:unnamed protein product [Dibothriocephalus latus]|uniref:Tetraspanin n=1 Tax=Dibothriocephalus latus TaxID=60516 RepID=A0A3P7M220_DIBLA|nr:unnamed protein product [Dibothriocephalus latus]